MRTWNGAEWRSQWVRGSEVAGLGVLRGSNRRRGHGSSRPPGPGFFEYGVKLWSGPIPTVLGCSGGGRCGNKGEGSVVAGVSGVGVIKMCSVFPPMPSPSPAERFRECVCRAPRRPRFCRAPGRAPRRLCFPFFFHPSLVQGDGVEPRGCQRGGHCPLHAVSLGSGACAGGPGSECEAGAEMPPEACRVLLVEGAQKGPPSVGSIPCGRMGSLHMYACARR